MLARCWKRTNDPGTLEVPKQINPSELRTLIGQRAERAYLEQHSEQEG